jgi:hypothetical protein
MGRQIIKQPNGKFCIFSSIVDSVIFYHMEEQDIINEWVEESRKEIEKKVKEIIADLNEGKKPYYQFTKTYDEMLQTIKEIHGTKEVKEIRKAIEG